MINVSIIMPCYNASAYLREAIESVLNQSYKDWELIIVDDGSTDNSLEVIREYVAKSPITNYQLQILTQPNSGACQARNNGLEHARGEYIKFLDADDILASNCLEEQMLQMQSLNPNQVPFGNYISIDDNGCLIEENPYSDDFLDAVKGDQVAFIFRYWQMLITCPLHRKSLLDSIGGFDETLKRGQETDLHFRLALAGVQFVYFPTHCFQYRLYQADTRISSNYKPNTEKFRANYIQMMYRREKQLLAHYVDMPKQYHRVFANFWFDMARAAYANKNKSEGEQAMAKAQSYGLHTAFQRFYSRIGVVLGYIPLEKIFQLRLKVLHKK